MDLSHQKTPKVNLDSAEHAFAYLRSNVLPPGQRMHVAVVGNHVSDDATFVGLLWPKSENDLNPDANAPSLAVRVNGLMVDLSQCAGIILDVYGEQVDLPWGDTIELWPLPQG